MFFKKEKRFNRKHQFFLTKRLHFLSNIKIAPKIMAGFLAIVLMCAVMGGIAALCIRQLGESIKQMQTEILLSVKSAGDLRNQFLEGNSALEKVLLTEDDYFNLAYLETIESSLSQIGQTLSVIETQANNAETVQYVQNVRASYDNYNHILVYAREKIRSGERQQIFSDVTYTLSLKDAGSAFQKSIEDFERVIDNYAAEKSAQNISFAEDVLSVTLLVTAAAILLAVVIGILISRSISQPVKSLTVKIKQLAVGDTDFDVTGNTRKDEIGQMSEAVRTILESIRALTQDTHMLIDAATEGQLSVRADTEKHQGSYRSIVEGINSTLDAMIAPINESAKVLEQLSRGNLNTVVEGHFKGDFAIIKDALNNTIQSLENYIGEISSVLNNVAHGNLNVSIESDFKGDFAALKESINTIVRSLNSILADISRAADQVASGTHQLSEGSQTISQGAMMQASSLEQLTASMSSVAEQTGRNAENAAKANELSFEATSAAQEGNSQMSKMQQAMTAINDSSENISRIIKVIDDIAFQTNILALNAAVEAARAGYHGKGFAVVADEVRNLAGRSAVAAKETTALIEESVKKINGGMLIADHTAKALGTIREGVDKIAGLVSGIAAASSEQASAIYQINTGIEQITQVVQTNSATSQQAAAASEQLSGQADMLKDMAGRFTFRQSSEMLLPENTAYEYPTEAKNSMALHNEGFGKY